MQIGKKWLRKYTPTPTHLHDAHDESEQTNGAGEDLNDEDTHKEVTIGSISKGSSGPYRTGEEGGNGE